MGTNSLNLVKINRRVSTINNLADANERIKACRELFIEVLKYNDLYVVATPETTKEQWESDKIKPYIAQAGQGDLYFMRIFSDKDVAKRAARRIESILEDGTEMIVKISTEQLVSVVKDYFILGVDGVLLNDGEDWITLNCEAFLHAAFVEVLNIPNNYDVNFVNTVKSIYDIANNRVRIVAPFKYYDDISEEDILNGKAELYAFGKELLLLEYYDKYKVENIFKEKVYWLDLSMDKYCKVMNLAKEAGLENIKVAYRNKEGNGSPENILGLLKATGLDR